MTEVGEAGLALGVLARHPPLEAAVESIPSVSSVSSSSKQRHHLIRINLSINNKGLSIQSLCDGFLNSQNTSKLNILCTEPNLPGITM